MNIIKRDPFISVNFAILLDGSINNTTYNLVESDQRIRSVL
jgi:hypothetical protein